MSIPTVVFAAEDSTSLQAMEPIANALTADMDVQYLLLDGLVKEEERTFHIDRSSLDHPYRKAEKWVRSGFLGNAARNVAHAGLQRVVVDNISPKLAFDVEGYIKAVNPDLFVSAIDQFGFIRHTIKALDLMDASTATIQHGIYEYALDFDRIESRQLFPRFETQISAFEALKRRAAFRYGLTEYTHPYSDVVFTLGDFFTERIRDIRLHSGATQTDLVTAGSPEFQGPVRSYSEGVSSVLFLSQQQYEGGTWQWSAQESVFERLTTLGDDFDVTIRPHPKESDDKVDAFAERFSVSRGRTIKEDIAAHDAVLSVNSTALFEAVIQGKVPGTLQIPEYRVGFEPFTHDHIIQVTDGSEDLDRLSRERSETTQREYLDSFCYLPGEDSSVATETTTELIAETLVGLPRKVH